MKKILILGLIASVSLLCCGCAGQYVPPVSVSGGWFGATVTVSEPGFVVPAQVVPAQVTAPTLVVPPNSAVTSGNIPITTATGSTLDVPVKVGPVTAPILNVPK